MHHVVGGSRVNDNVQVGTLVSIALIELNRVFSLEGTLSSIALFPFAHKRACPLKCCLSRYLPFSPSPSQTPLYYNLGSLLFNIITIAEREIPGMSLCTQGTLSICNIITVAERQIPAGVQQTLPGSGETLGEPEWTGEVFQSPWRALRSNSGKCLGKPTPPRTRSMFLQCSEWCCGNFARGLLPRCDVERSMAARYGVRRLELPGPGFKSVELFCELQLSKPTHPTDSKTC